MDILFFPFYFINLFIIITSHSNYSNEKICSYKNKYMDIFKDIIIPISMALDDAYIYPTIVSITSIMINSNKNTKYIFYIMHPTEFKIENKKKLKSLEKKYNKCIINLIDMEGKYKNAWTSGRVTTPAYYRLSLPIILSDIDKILWLDGDTLILTDLKEMYDINMEGFYYKGFLDTVPDDVDIFTTENDHAICTGVMIINLDELRKDDMMNKVHKFMKEKKEILSKKKYHDQTLINAVCYHKVGILPPKFGIFNTINSFNRIHYLCTKTYRYKNKYTEKELINAYYNPAILHFIAKPWKIEKCLHQDLWWEYAKKTDYFDEMYQIYLKQKKHKNPKKKFKKIIKIILIIGIILFYIKI